MTISYEVTIGSQTYANTGAGSQRQPVLGIDSEIAVGGSVGVCLLEFGDITWANPGIGDPVQVTLDVGDGASPVFSGEVAQVRQRPGAHWVWAHDSMALLARIEVESAYEEVSAGFIVSDLIDQAGAEAGEIEDGPTFPSYVVHRGPRALRHALRLGELVGAELASDGEGKVHFRRPTSGAAAHRLVWAEDLIEIDLGPHAPARDSFAVFGEGAAGTEGAERGHWLPTDLSGVSGEAAANPGGDPDQTGRVAAGSTGSLVRTVIDGALRAAEDAADVASARAQLLALRPLSGHAVGLGNPAIQPGDWVELAGLPGSDGERTVTLRALRVIHRLSNQGGLLTRMEF